jgi:hypothetical protein
MLAGHQPEIMLKCVLFVLLGTFLLGLALAVASFREHLHGAGLPLLLSLREQRTPRGRLLFKRFTAGMVVACLSIVLLLALGPVKLERHGAASPRARR